MKRITISEEELLSRYMSSLDEFLDECDWVTTIPGEMVCSLVVAILTEQRVNVFMSSTDLYEAYSTHVKGLGLTDEEWRENYGIPEIIGILWDILEGESE